MLQAPAIPALGSTCTGWSPTSRGRQEYLSVQEKKTDLTSHHFIIQNSASLWALNLMELFVRMHVQGPRWCATRARGRCSGSTGWCSCSSSSWAARRCTRRGGGRTSAPATLPSSTTSACPSPPSTSTARGRPEPAGGGCDHDHQLLVVRY
uniref:Uncharacterized protein n=1 Tax=Triticum urartu TaxID=4572 RepID=A0A8R7PQR7_TRIUA